jgi:hypothetical protein
MATTPRPSVVHVAQEEAPSVRQAYRHGHERRQLTLGGRRVGPP